MTNRISAYVVTHKKLLLIITVFAAALALRFFLSLYNREANDDHMEVVNWILDKKEVPTKEDCWECSQPKFYYFVNAGLIRMMHLKAPVRRLIAAQMFNFFLGAGILLFAWGFIRNQTPSFRIRILAFSVVALNPCLTGINGQATNDTLEILAGCAVIYFTDLYIRRLKPLLLTGLIISMIIACITKGSGLILLLGVIVVLSVHLFILPREKKKMLLLHSVIFAVALLSIVPFAGGYYANYKKYGNAFINNISQKDPPPNFIEQTYLLRPGITSIVHGYFTFRIIDMVKQPYITNGETDYPLHRTSLWSQMYGRTFFMHFDQFPGSWSTLNPKVLRVGKGLLLLGLFPLFIFLAGSASAIRRFFRAMFRRNAALLTEQLTWVHAAFVISGLLFILKYTYDYRDFATMKSIFLFPVLLSIIALFIAGFEKVRSRPLGNIITVALSILVVLSAIDVLYLINQLQKLA